MNKTIETLSKVIKKEVSVLFDKIEKIVEEDINDINCSLKAKNSIERKYLYLNRELNIINQNDTKLFYYELFFENNEIRVELNINSNLKTSSRKTKLYIVAYSTLDKIENLINDFNKS